MKAVRGLAGAGKSRKRIRGEWVGAFGGIDKKYGGEKKSVRVRVGDKRGKPRCKSGKLPD